MNQRIFRNLRTNVKLRGVTTSSHPDHRFSIPAVYYRGGTSRAIFFQRRDLPKSRADWDDIFRGALGSPDPYGRQMNGIGGGISSLSKICVVAPSEREGIDVDFTFAQVGVKTGAVDYAGTCGNMTSAVGPFVVDEEWLSLPPSAKSAIVRIFNTNTSKVVHSNFSVSAGRIPLEGDLAIDGVAGTAPPIRLDFMDPGGAVTGKLLPSGNVIDVLDGVDATCLDVTNPMVFVRASDIGVSGEILPADLDKKTDVLKRLESIRQKASAAMQISKTSTEAPSSIPKICILSPPSTHKLISGATLDESSISIVARGISVGQPHRAVPITMALCLAAAAKIPGSVAHGCLKRLGSEGEDGEQFTIGHPSGTLKVGATYTDGKLETTSVYRTARRLFEGRVFWK